MLACVPIFTWANQQSIPIQNDFSRFQQQTKNQQEQLQQIQQQRWLSRHQYQAEQQADVYEDLSQVCLPYNEVRFVGFHLIDPLPFSPKKNECLNEVRLNRLSQELTSAYLALGYIYNPFQFEDDGSGKLTMRVTEGKISLLSSNSDRLNFAMLLPNSLGKPLNIKELDQALDQANKMPGSKVSVDVLPAKSGEIELSFVNEEKSRVTGYVGMDNFASKRSGRWQVKGGLNIDNPLGLSDSLYFNVSHSLKSHHNNFNRSFSFFHTIPYGYWSLSTFGSFSAFKSNFPLQYNTVEQKGHTWQAALRTDYTFQRDSNSISNLYAQLERIKSKSYFADSLILFQSPTLTAGQIGINHLQLFSYGSLMTDFSYERGLKWWNATLNQGRDQPEGQFNRWRAELQFSAFYPIKSLTFHQSSRLIGHYSHNHLPAIKQEELLGRYAVRGFNDLSLSAEKGIVLQNDLGWLYQYQQWQIKPYLGMDIGVQKPILPDANSQKAFAYVLGLKTSHPRWYMQLEWATGRLFQQNQVIQERSVNVNWNIIF
ncbi:hemin-binding protein [Rodentibacter trehalosifermentans]|uniref:Hemin-binding protein n=1 Tax=Rodentibacter trehalosifermentans TaxID=1908263 RepID=A0A1V3IN92_9PAST|nr:hemin-binding protein [Rodentibacter trehalosifermentans]